MKNEESSAGSYQPGSRARGTPRNKMKFWKSYLPLVYPCGSPFIQPVIDTRAQYRGWHYRCATKALARSFLKRFPRDSLRRQPRRRLSALCADKCKKNASDRFYSCTRMYTRHEGCRASYFQSVFEWHHNTFEGIVQLFLTRFSTHTPHILHTRIDKQEKCTLV